MKIVGYYVIYLIGTIFLTPLVITWFFSGGSPPAQAVEDSAAALFTELKYMDTATASIASIPFENYIKGVVAAEMPALFEPEALKAQAVAARTYALRHVDPDTVHQDLSYLGQAYISPEEMEARWGGNFTAYYNRISQAVDSTAGEIIKYEGEPIEAVFHSTSAGVTENSEDVWKVALPYLTSVASPYDEMAPDFESSSVFTSEEAAQRLGIMMTLRNPDSILQNIHILDYTGAGYVKTVQVEEEMFTGGEIRSAFGLRSANFTLALQALNGEQVLVFTTRGYGHGAGMSQYGANFMAKEGYDYQQILSHYYQGAYIEAYDRAEDGFPVPN